MPLEHTTGTAFRRPHPGAGKLGVNDMKHALKQTEPYAVWPIEAPVSRNFECEIVAPSGGLDGSRNDFDARLKLRANTHVSYGQRENNLSIILQSEGAERWTNLERMEPVRELWPKLESRGFYLDAKVRALGLRLPRYGTWRRYMLEVAKAHTALEILGWELTEEEQAIMDAVDAYGRQASAWVLERVTDGERCACRA